MYVKKKMLFFVVFFIFISNSFARAPKYVFLFIGDGMAPPQIFSTNIFMEHVGKKDSLEFLKFKVNGFTTTRSADSFITDSAAAGTAISTGNKTKNGIIGMDSSKRIIFKTIAEIMKNRYNKKIGIITSVSLDHATPASFYAHVPSRGMYYKIAKQMIDSGFDYFAGGGLKGNSPGKRKGRKNLIIYAKAHNYTIIQTKKAFSNLQNGVEKVIAINPILKEGASLPYAIDKKSTGISLAEFTKKGISLLKNSKKGFFMMVEGGKIDWACHANDAATTIYDMIAFNNAIKEAVKFYKDHPHETLIIVTGDHETGGMSIGFAGTKYKTFFDKIKYQTVSYEEFDKYVASIRSEKDTVSAKWGKMLLLIKKFFGIGNKNLPLNALEIIMLKEAFKKSMNEEKGEYLLYGGYEPITITITHILNEKAGIGWTTYSHTGVPVMTFAEGCGAQLFSGYYDNTDIFKKLLKIMEG